MSKNIRFTCQITFEVEDVTVLHPGCRTELKAFIIEALEAWGGQRPPEDWLSGSFEHVVVGAIKEGGRS